MPAVVGRLSRPRTMLWAIKKTAITAAAILAITAVFRTTKRRVWTAAFFFFRNRAASSSIFARSASGRG
jgi:hypothetical protein